MLVGLKIRHSDCVTVCCCVVGVAAGLLGSIDLAGGLPCTVVGRGEPTLPVDGGKVGAAVEDTLFGVGSQG